MENRDGYIKSILEIYFPLWSNLKR